MATPWSEDFSHECPSDTSSHRFLAPFSDAFPWRQAYFSMVSRSSFHAPDRHPVTFLPSSSFSTRESSLTVFFRVLGCRDGALFVMSCHQVLLGQLISIQFLENFNAVRLLHLFTQGAYPDVSCRLVLTVVARCYREFLVMATDKHSVTVLVPVPALLLVPVLVLVLVTGTV